jgi:hypothetical protein
MAAPEGVAVGEAEATIDDAAVVVGLSSAMGEGADVAWGPPAEEKSSAPAMMTATRPMRPSPTKMGVELRRAGVGA